MGNEVDNHSANEPRTYEFALGDELRGERATMGKSLLDVQRDLRIKANYIAAIEDCEPEVFPNPGFVPGYIRSYARYLGLDSDEIYARFCAESGFAVGSAAIAPGSIPRPNPVKGAGTQASRNAVPLRSSGTFRPDFPMAGTPVTSMPSIPFSAIGSLLVLLGLVIGLGYGGWTVLQNIQRVQFVPVEELPLATVAVDPLQAPATADLNEPGMGDLASPVTATALADLYRQQELEVPILVPRDGPIASIDPDGIGLLAGYGSAREAKLVTPAQGMQAVSMPAIAMPAVATPAALAAGPQVTATAERPEVTVVTERAAWMRVYLENGTVIFERILEKGDSYSPPADVELPLIWAGNSGSVYVRVGDTLRGPLGSGTSAVRDVLLEPQSLTERFAVVDNVPEAITQTMGSLSRRAEVAVVTD